MLFKHHATNLLTIKFSSDQIHKMVIWKGEGTVSFATSAFPLIDCSIAIFQVNNWKKRQQQEKILMNFFFF